MLAFLLKFRWDFNLEAIMS